MDMALAFHVPPWEVENNIDLDWWRRWQVWNEEQPKADKKKPDGKKQPIGKGRR